jgi:hypothetical protein
MVDGRTPTRMRTADAYGNKAYCNKEKTLPLTVVTSIHPTLRFVLQLLAAALTVRPRTSLRSEPVGVAPLSALAQVDISGRLPDGALPGIRTTLPHLR